MAGHDDSTETPYSGGSKRRRNTIIAVVALVAVTAAGAFLYLQNRSSSPDSLYRTAVASEAHLVVTVSADGRAVPVRSTDVYPAVSGTVIDVYVELGDEVKAGDQLYAVDTSALHGATLQAESALASQQRALEQAYASQRSSEQALAQARATLLQTTQNLAALESKPTTTPGLPEQIALAQAQKASAEKGVAAAEASVKAAKVGISASAVSVESAQYAYDDAASNEGSAVVVAPVGGVITTMDLAVGTAASGNAGGASSASAGMGTSGASVVISDTSEYQVSIDISESQRSQVEIGQDVQVTFGALRGVETSGTVTWIAPAGTNNSGVITYQVDISLGSRPEGLEQGMSAAVEIVTAEFPEALIIPTAAVKADGAEKYVVLLEADGTTRAVVIETGDTVGTDTRVVSGISDGDVVILGLNSDTSGITLPSPSASDD